MSNQAPILPIREYCGKTDSRTPPQFLREFTMSTLCTGVNGTDTKNLLALLGDQFSIYAPAFPYTKTLDDMKRYFLQLTWTSIEKQKELKAIQTEKFDPSGPESWEKYLIQTYIRLQDCEACDTDFQKLMNHKLFEVERIDLPVSNFVVQERKQSSLSYDDQPRQITVQRVRSKDLDWFAPIVYAQSNLESQEQLKLQEKVSAEVDHQLNSELGRQPKAVPVEVIRPSDPEPDNFQGQRHEINFCGCGSQVSFQEPLLLSVFYFIIYFLILQFWNFGNNFDISIVNSKKN